VFVVPPPKRSGLWVTLAVIMSTDPHRLRQTHSFQHAGLWGRKAYQSGRGWWEISVLSVAMMLDWQTQALILPDDETVGRHEGEIWLFIARFSYL